jgi:hypothetical protein
MGRRALGFIQRRLRRHTLQEVDLPSLCDARLIGMPEQSDPGVTPRRSPHAEISNQISRIQSAYYGKGPLRAKTYIVDDLVVCVLEETFTRAERP